MCHCANTYVLISHLGKYYCWPSLFHRKLCADHDDHLVCPRLIVEVGLLFCFCFISVSLCLLLLWPIYFFILVRGDVNTAFDIYLSRKAFKTSTRGKHVSNLVQGSIAETKDSVPVCYRYNNCPNCFFLILGLYSDVTAPAAATRTNPPVHVNYLNFSRNLIHCAV